MNTYRQPWLCLLGGAMIILAGGCRSQAPRAVTVPELALTHYAGTPLARAEGPATRPAEAEALAVIMRAYLLSRAGIQAMQPFASGASIVTSSGGESPLLALPTSLADARLGVGPMARQMAADAAGGLLGPVVDLGEQRAALAAGTSAQLRVGPGEVKNRADGLQELELVLSRSEVISAPLRLALTRQTIGVAPTEDEAPAGVRLPQPRRETAVTALEYAQGQERELAVLVPVSFSAELKQSMLLIVRIAPGSDDPLHQAAVEAAGRDLATETGERESASYEQLVLQSALAAAESSEGRRAALVYLATQGQAPILMDMALVADDGVLEALVAELKGMPEEKVALGWRLDRLAFDMMGRQLIAKQLSPELRAVLSRHAGEAGRRSAVMDQLIGKAISRRDLENRLIAENYILLEDVSPAARVHAYDWLKGKGKAPAGFDPLGPVEARRKALEAAIEQMAQKSGEGK